MARFRGTVQGARGEASRLGHAGTGLKVEANGWDVGVRVTAAPMFDDSTKDGFDIYATGGSVNAHSPMYLGTVTLKNGRPEFIASKCRTFSLDKAVGIS